MNHEIYRGALYKYILKRMESKSYIIIDVEERCPLQFVRPAGDKYHSATGRAEPLEGQVVPLASTIIGAED